MEDNKGQTSGGFDASIFEDIQVPVIEGGEDRQNEQRLCARYPVSISVEGVELQSKAHFTGRISDLSMGGCYVDSITALPVDATLKVRLVHEGKVFETRARVITSSPSMGMSLLFVGTEPGQLEVLEAWVRELSGETPPCEPELPEIKAQQSMEPGSNSAQLGALNELILELMRTGVLSDLKGRAILQKAFRR
jgi:hypothetical protein